MEPVDGSSADGGRDAATRRVAGNTLWLLAAEVVAKVASLVFVVIVARAIGVREYGYFTFATSFVPLFLMLGSLGVDRAVVRAVAPQPERLSEIFVSGLQVRVVSGVLGLLLSLAVGPLFLDDPVAVLTLVVVGAALLLDALAVFVATVFEAFERMRHFAIALVVNRIGSTALALVVFLAGGDLTAILLTYLTGSVLALVYAVRALRRHFPPLDLRAARWATSKDLLRQGAPLGLAAILNTALLRLDTVMVAAYLGAQEVGLYGVAFRFFESFLFVAYALGDAGFPRYTKLGPGRESARSFQTSTAVALSFYVPLFVITLFAPTWAVTTLFGARYADAAQAVPWLTAATVFYATTYLARTAAMAVGARNSIAGIAAVALVVNVALNVALIPEYGFTGAAMATAAASGLETLLTLIAFRRLGVPVRCTRLMLVPVLAGLGVAGLLVSTGLSGGPAVAVAVAVYPAVLALLFVLLARDEHDGLRVLLRRRRAVGQSSGRE